MPYFYHGGHITKDLYGSGPGVLGGGESPIPVGDWYAGDGTTQPASITAAGDGQPVDAWADDSPSGLDLAGAGAARPTYDLSVAALNNRGGVIFNGSHVLSRSVAASPVASAPVLNIFIVFVANNSNVGCPYGEGRSTSTVPMIQPNINYGGAAVNTPQGLIRDDASLSYAMESGRKPSGDGNAHVLTLRKRSSDHWEVRLDGQLRSIYRVSFGSFTLDRISIGALVRTTVGSYLYGTIGRVSLYDRDVFNTVEPVLAAHYGITLTSTGEVSASQAYGAGHPINQVRFRDAALVTQGGYQAQAYWASDGFLTLGVRAAGGSWTLYHYDGVSATPAINVKPDSHNVCNIGVDADGYLHLAYNMHNNALLYRRSSQPLATWTGGLTNVLSMVGTNETAVSYPTFVTSPAGVLYFLFRDGGSGNGDLFMYAYNKTTHAWTAVTGSGAGGKIIDGKASTNSPYWDTPVFDDTFGSGGFMHLSWVWRDTTAGTSNFNYAYMRWDGTNWTTIAGAAQTMPATVANCDTIQTIASGSGLSNQNGLDADSNGYPHIAYFMDDASDHNHLNHLYWNGAGWINLELTATNTPSFAVDTYLDIGRPLLAIDRTDDTVYILYRDDYAASRGLLLQTSDPGDFTAWTQSVAYATDVGYLEPNYDRPYWEANKVFMMQLNPWFDTGMAGFATSILTVTP